MLMKGPEVAANYRFHPTVRSGTLDLLVKDPEAAQRALIAPGFVDQRRTGGVRRPSAPAAAHVAGRSSCGRGASSPEPAFLACRDRPRACSASRCRVPQAYPGSLLPTPQPHAVLVVAPYGTTTCSGVWANF